MPNSPPLAQFVYRPGLETRPSPGQGYLLTKAELCGGGVCALLEEFFQSVGRQLPEVDSPTQLYERMNRLTEAAPSGAEGLRCRPLFFGSRSEPGAQAQFSGVTPANFTPGHLTRSLFEGMADLFVEDYEQICHAAGRRFDRLLGAGNGIRRNPILRRIISDKFRMPLELSPCGEEAAIGAARVAAGKVAGSERSNPVATDTRN